MILSAIAAMSSNRVIGKDGTLPWNLPEDMKFFKDKTTGHIMLMGRKTFQSFGGRLLPNRLHVVVTRASDFAPPGAHVFLDFDKALEFCASQTAKWGEEVFVIGGGEVYRELLPRLNRIYLTEIHKEFPGDVTFPAFDTRKFIEVSRHKRSEPLPFDFVLYESQEN